MFPPPPPSQNTAPESVKLLLSILSLPNGTNSEEYIFEFHILSTGGQGGAGGQAQGGGLDDGDVVEAGAEPRGFVKYHNSIPSRLLFHSLSLSK